MNDNNFESLLEEFINQTTDSDFQDLFMDSVINNVPLYTPLTRMTDEHFLLNQQVINNFYNIRRYLDIETTINQSPTHVESVELVEPVEPVEPDTISLTDSELFREELFSELVYDFYAANPDCYDFNILFDTLYHGFNRVFNDTFSDTFNDTFNELKDVKIILSEADFDKLNHITITKNNLKKFNDKICNICMDTYKNTNILTELPCNHLFHKECIKQWVCSENVHCPMCRHDTREK